MAFYWMLKRSDKNDKKRNKNENHWMCTETLAVIREADCKNSNNSDLFDEYE